MEAQLGELDQCHQCEHAGDCNHETAEIGQDKPLIVVGCFTGADDDRGPPNRPERVRSVADEQ